MSPVENECGRWKNAFNGCCKYKKEPSNHFTCRVDCGSAIVEIYVSIGNNVMADVDCCLLDYGTGNRMGVVERDRYSCSAELEKDILLSLKKLQN